MIRVAPSGFIKKRSGGLDPLSQPLIVHIYRPIARDVTGRAQWAALEDNWSRFLWRKCTEAAFNCRSFAKNVSRGVGRGEFEGVRSNPPSDGLILYIH